MLRFALVAVVFVQLHAQDWTKCPSYPQNIRLIENRLRVQREIAVHRAVYSPMEEIEVTVTIRNPSDRELEIPDSEEPELCGLVGMSQVITTAGGEPQYHPLQHCEGRHTYQLPPAGPCPGVAKFIVLAPHGSKTMRFTLRAPETEGNYVVFGRYNRTPASFQVVDPRIVAVAEIQRTATERTIRTMSRATVIESADGMQSLMLATLPDWDSRRFDPRMGTGMAARSGAFNRIRRIAADRRSIANLKLTEDPALPDVLIVTFEEDGIQKRLRFNAVYEEIR